MRRVLTGLLLPALLTCLLLGTTVAATAAEVDAVDTGVVVALEGGGELEGPTPGDPNASENVGAPVDYEAPFLWKASIGLLAVMVGIVGLLGGLYYLLVVRPSRSSSTSA